MAHRCLTFVTALVLFAGLPASGAVNWTQPTPEELKMTADPAAPGVGAEYLFLQTLSAGDRVDVYARIKILTEKGRDKYSDVRMDYVRGDESVFAVEGRTIHPDGTVISFTGKPYDKELASYAGTTRMEKVFSMPDVQVGSILEFRYAIRYSFIGTPIWHVQQELFVRRASFRFQPSPDYPVQVTQMLPPGAKVQGTALSGFDLAMENIPALPDEAYSPPMHALGYRVEFLYSPYSSGAEFWKKVGKNWSGNVNDVTAPSGKLKEAVDQITAASATDEQKLEKIYAAVMKLENTSFTRERTKEENKAQRVKTKTASDVWNAQRGNRDEITLLFVTMARAAKLKAYVMYVTDRSSQIFLKDIPDADQLDDYIAIVNVEGKDEYFDPGERYCEFGKLKWTHTWTGGIRQTDFSGAELGTTPTPTYTDTQTTRRGEVQMAEDGTLGGTIRVSMTGDEALRWRQDALRSDEQETLKKFGDAFQESMAPGVRVKAKEFSNLTDSTQPLIAKLEVSGTMGTKAGHRLILPSSFFEAHQEAPFASETRVTPVYMHYPYEVEDQLKLTLPADTAIESVPQDAEIPFVPNADFMSKYRGSGTTYLYARRIRVANILYEPKDYGKLRGFFQSVNGQDQAQLVLKAGAGGSAGPAVKSE
jgi:hypothetical protein